MKTHPYRAARAAIIAALILVGIAAGAAAQSGQGGAGARDNTPAAAGQSNVPEPVQQAEGAIEDAVRRYRIGVSGGVGLDPEIIIFGAHGAFGPIFHPSLQFRPGIEFGVGEVTTVFGINLEALYTLPGAVRGTRWLPYVGLGPNFGVSHRGFEAEGDDLDNVDVDGTPIADRRNRFDFSDTDFKAGMNFIVGARRGNGMFIEMKATAYGVTNVRLLAGFNF